MSPCCTLLSRPLAHKAVFEVAKALFSPIGNAHHSACRCLILCSILTILGCAHDARQGRQCKEAMDNLPCGAKSSRHSDGRRRSAQGRRGGWCQ
jgi:hypothetical protein